jgi:hypothetical protein
MCFYTVPKGGKAAFLFPKNPYISISETKLELTGKISKFLLTECAG